MLEKTLAGLGLLLCAAVAIGMWMGPRRVEKLRQALLQGWHWRARRQARQAAEAQAALAIQRARQGGKAGVEREGNVLRPTAFKRPPDDRLH